MSDQGIAIVGMGCMLPEAGSLAEAWRNIEGGKDCIRDIPLTHWRPDEYYDANPRAPDMTYAKRGGFLRPYKFNPIEWGITPNAVEATDTSQILGMVVAHHALVDAGIGPESSFDKSRVSVIMGVTGTLGLVVPLGARLGHPLWRKALKDSGVDDTTANEVVERIKAGYVGWQTASFPGLLGNVVAGRIANRFDLGGTNCVVDAACASSLAAVNLAMLELEAGRCDAVVTGGVDTFNDIFMYMCFSKTPALSASGEARPFDKSSDGTALGEGVGALVLKRLADARRDGDRVYAVIKSIGTSSDGHGQAIYAPAVKGQVAALRRAYTAAGVSPTTIELVEAHGTGTKVGDAIETQALSQVFREAKGDGDWCSVGTIKAQIGHTKAAAGVAGLIKATMALHRRVLPPSIKVALPSDALAGSPFRVETRARPWVGRDQHPRRAGVSAFGFGGSNFHAVLEEAPTDLARTPYGLHDLAAILAYAADERSEIAKNVAEDLETLAKAAAEDIGDAVLQLRTLGKTRRAAFSAKAAHRLTVVLETTSLAADDLRSLAAKLARRFVAELPEASWSEGGRAYYDTRTFSGKVAAIFPGQGAQYPGMLQALTCRSPELLAAVEAADAAFAREHGRSLDLAESLFPPPAWTDADKEQQRARLTETQRAQPAIGAVSLGALRTLEGLGFRFDAAAGHSFGELTALCAAGWIDSDAFHKLAVTRGKLMAGDGGDRGGMLAVAGSRTDIEAQARAAGLELVLANHNAPKQAVLAGPKHEIERAAAAFLAAGLGAKQLDVAAGFHSPLVADAAVPFAEALGGVAFKPHAKPVVYANRSGAAYPADAKKARRLLAEQIASPVEFVTLIRQMHTDGVRAFVEIGPGKRLSGLVRQILDGEAIDILGLDEASDGAGIDELARLTARLAARGISIDLDRWDADFVPAPTLNKTNFSIAICGANHFVPKAARLKAKRQKEMTDTQMAPTTPTGNGGTTHSWPAAHAVPTANGQTLPRSAAGPVVPSVAVSGATVSSTAMPGTAAPNGATPGPAIAGGGLPFTPAPSMSMPAASVAPTVIDPFMQHAIQSLQRMQEQNADLHRQFLQNQMTSQAMLFGLLGCPTANVLAPTVTPTYAAPTPYVPVAPTYTPMPAQAMPAPMPMAPQNGYVPAPMPTQAYAMPAAPAAMPQATPPRAGATAAASVSIAPPLSAATGNTQAAPLGGATASSAAAPDLIRQTLLAVVAEKTGYPADMIDPSMSLEGDLGIDSIKRVEIMADLQSRLPTAGSVKPEELTKLATLNEIIAKLAAGNPQSTGAPAATNAVATGAPAPQAAAAAGGSFAEIAAVLVEIVAEKTGYPADMVGLDMQMEGDLGIDSIKRVEILSALQERLPSTKVAPAEMLSRCKTLAEIAETAAEAAAQKKKLADVVEPPASTPATAPPTLASPSQARPALDVYAVQMVEAPAPGRIALTATPERRELIIAAAAPQEALPRALATRLTQRGFAARVLALADCAATSVPALAGLVIVAPADAAKGMSEDPAAAREFLLGGLRAARAHAKALNTKGKDVARLASVSFAGGRFAHAEASGGVAATTPFRARCAAIAGLIKTAGHEWDHVATVAFDVDPSIAVDELADRVVDDLLRETPAELGLTASGRLTPMLLPTTVPPVTGTPVGDGGLVVVTGGARGVTAHSILALASRRRRTFLLLGRSPLPEQEPAWLASLTDPGAIKRALVANSAKKLSPRELQSAYDGVVNAREMRATLAALHAAGCSAMYRAVDARDAAALSAAVAGAVAEHGPVRGIVHGAGILADRLIEAQTDEQFLSVYDTKVQGFDALLAAVDARQLQMVALFSSTTARLGRKGQGAYAVANEALNKEAQQLAATLPAAKVVAFGWGPWAGGMVSPALAKLFAEEGIALVGLDAGAELFAATMDSPAPGAVEQIVVGIGTRLAPEPTAEPAAVEAGSASFDIEASVAGIPVLRDHVLGGRAVVPAALLMEWMALAAAHLNPGLEAIGLDGFRVLKGVVLDAHDALSLQAQVGRLQLTTDGYVAPVMIVSRRADGHALRHAAAEVRLADSRPHAPQPSLTPIADGGNTTPDRVYQNDLFHGPEMQGIVRILGQSADGVCAMIKAAPAPAAWWRAAPRAVWLTEPLAVDVAFQLMVLWTKASHGAPSLPSAVRRYRQFVRAFPAQGCEARLRVSEHGAHKAVGDIEFIAPDGALIARLEGYEATIDASLARAFERRAFEEARG